MPAATDKVIVTNIKALRHKHGIKGLARIRHAVRHLIAADRKRGIRTRLIAIDHTDEMKPYGHAVRSAHNARQAKRAIDAIDRALDPDYIMILGAPDVVPHVRFPNPAADSDDPDEHVESDLPYACDAGWSHEIEHFLGPTRVVGRLPDTAGTGDTDRFVTVIENAARWKRRPVSDYAEHFSLSTESWSGSTRASIRNIFGSSAGVHLSPQEGPSWPREVLAPRVHFINCHGDVGRPEFYGEDKHDDDIMPRAHLAYHLEGRVRTGTVVAAECCYGAHLYAPLAEEDTAICQSYLTEGAWGFFGSTTIAYGPVTGQNWADLLCVAFIKHVLAGASIGRAALMARQDYIHIDGTMEPVDLKTIAQFTLLGDPSVHPVRVHAKTKAARAALPAFNSRARAKRRKTLRAAGQKLGRETASVATLPDTKASRRIRAAIGRECRKRSLRGSLAGSFRLHAPEGRVHARTGRDRVARGTVYHVIVPKQKRRSGRSAVKAFRVLVAREEGGKIAHMTEAVRHGPAMKHGK